MLYKNILFIDDDIDDTEIFMGAVSDIEKDIIFKSEDNPVKALEDLKVSEKLPDLIFLDYNMPLLNGKEFLDHIKNSNRLKEIPIILISSPSEEFVTDLLAKKEILNYICKPNSYTELVRLLKSILKTL